MKYMKFGNLEDTFYTEEAARTVLSHIPCDLNIQINNVRYQLHKFPLLLKCGFLQSLCSDSEDSGGEASAVPLHDIPGGEGAFELCVKFCYGISVVLSAHNVVQAICAAKFLRMTESVAKGNLVTKLESFFNSWVLQGWKDSVVALQETRKVVVSSSESLVDIFARRCLDSILRKILTHPSKVTWSYTYTRQGFDKSTQRSAPKDWWTEDVADIDLDFFQSIISSIRSTKQIPPPLIGEALHVYTCKHLLDPQHPQNITSISNKYLSRQRRVLESIVSMIPAEQGSVSGRFLLRLLKIASVVRASPSTRAELVRRAGRKLHEVTAEDLLFCSPSSPEGSVDVDLVEALLETFLVQFRRPVREEDADGMLASMTVVGRTVDSYLQLIAYVPNVPVSRIVELAQTLPELVRPEHDELYKAVDIYIKEHPGISKTEKKNLCQILDTRKLSQEVRSHAIRNDQLPLRTIVQVLFVEQERATERSSSQVTPRTIIGFPGIGKSISCEKKEGEIYELEKGQQGRRKNKIER